MSFRGGRGGFRGRGRGGYNRGGYNQYNQGPPESVLGRVPFGVSDHVT